MTPPGLEIPDVSPRRSRAGPPYIILPTATTETSSEDTGDKRAAGS